MDVTLSSRAPRDTVTHNGEHLSKLSLHNAVSE